MSRQKLIGINHVALEVDDLDEALEFYGRIFEIRLRGRSRGAAFIDIGDQFIALEAARTQPPDAGRHIGIVVDDRDEAVRALVEAGAERVGGNDVLDPWGNRLQIVDYRDVQFTKAAWILEGMGLGDLEKHERAQEELRAKGLAPPA